MELAVVLGRGRRGAGREVGEEGQQVEGARSSHGNGWLRLLAPPLAAGADASVAVATSILLFITLFRF